MSSTKILIVVDMQNDFIYGNLGSEAARNIVPKVADKIESNKDNIIFFTRDTHRFNYLSTLEGQKFPVKHCLRESAGWCIVDELLPYTSGRKIIDKYTFAFDEWDKYITSSRISEWEIELCGVCTDICLISNALTLRMLFPDTKITVDAKCCAGTDEVNHKAALQVMKSCLIDVIDE